MNSDEIKKMTKKANETIQKALLAALGIKKKPKPLINPESELIQDIDYEEVDKNNKPENDIH